MPPLETAATKREHFKPALLALILLALLLERPGEAQRRVPRVERSGQPKLVLAIIVDQFRYDYLERFGDLFGAGGFRRLINEGAVFTDANYEHMPTYTAVGHAAIFSGSVPAQNGIVGNLYYDRRSGKQRVIVSDDDAHLVTSSGVGAAGAASPRVLIGTTIGDQMRLATNFKSKVVAVSLKDRSAVLPAGQRPNGAYWFGEANGEFVSSDYYAKELPKWVRDFNSSTRPDKWFGATWDRSLAADAYNRAQQDSVEVQSSVLGRKFPYKVTGGLDKPGPQFNTAFLITPFASEYLASFARAAVEGESLGTDEFPDLLSVSFSSPDLCGHYYGPDSQETVDTYARLDKTIAELLDFIDKRVGLANTVIAVTGDHGVAPVPEYMASKGYAAARLQPRGMIDSVDKALSERFGLEKAVVAFVNDQLYFDQNQIGDKKLDPREVENAAAAVVMSTPGVVSCFTRTQLLNAQVPAGPIGRRIMNGFNRDRCGDVWLVTRPFFFFTEGTLPTTHGSPYSYDSHVPVILFGSGVHAGRYNEPASPADIAPTIAALLGVEPPSNRVARVLSEAIAGRAAVKP
jgi:predicted AlkP superfamily pyrophosphatase or phosphodiesterase